jgi:HAD superfamily hydrolase (TIGR01662 family)
MKPNRSLGVLGDFDIPLGLGLLRLSTEGRPDWDDAIGVIHHALDLGIRLLDTADSYALDEKDLHYGESLAREAIGSWKGPRQQVRIVTKVGLARPGGKWMPAGSPRQITKAIEGSMAALECDQLFLVQLHAKDPRVPFEQTLGALAELQRSGKILHLGLCNVGPAEIRQAQRHFQVQAVQNELSILSQASATEGTVRLSQDMGIPFLAHRPLGGYAKVEKLDKNRVLNPIASRKGCTPREVALAALLQSGNHVLPLIGARRKESLDSCLRGLQLQLNAEDRSAIATKYSFAASAEALEAIAPRVVPDNLPELAPDAGPGTTAEVVLLMGIQGSGKSTHVQGYVDHGYVRLNRDDAGGKLDDLLPELKRLLAEGQHRVVLDNTYPTRLSRGPVISAAHAHTIPVRCRWIDTPVAEARINVVTRILDRYGKLIGPVEWKELAKSDPNLPPPIAMQKWMDSFEPPERDEGFSAIDRIPFQRRLQPDWTERGLLLDVDGTIRTTLSGEIYPRHPDDVQLLEGRREVLQRWIDEGYLLFFVSNQSGVASGHVTSEAVEASFQRTIDLLGLPIQQVAYCPHPAFPVGCFCRKPMPGLAIDLMRRYRLSPQHLVMVGDMESDAQFASGVGARYFDAKEFFGV